MKSRLHKSLLTVSAILMSCATIAHPGDHEALSTAAGATHFLTDPGHLPVALALAAAAVALLSTRRRDRSRDR